MKKYLFLTTFIFLLLPFVSKAETVLHQDPFGSSEWFNGDFRYSPNSAWMSSGITGINQVRVKLSYHPVDDPDCAGISWRMSGFDGAGFTANEHPVLTTTPTFYTFTFANTRTANNLYYLTIETSGIPNGCTDSDLPQALRFYGHSVTTIPSTPRNWFMCASVASFGPISCNAGDKFELYMDIGTTGGSYSGVGAVAEVYFTNTLRNGISLADFNKWNICYNVPITTYPGIRTLQMEVYDNRTGGSPQTDTLPTFTSDFLAGTNMGCIELPKGISLSPGSHTLEVALNDTGTSTTLAWGPPINVTIIAGDPTEIPVPIVPTVEAPRCEGGGAIEYAFCKTMDWLFIPSGDFAVTVQNKINEIKDDVYEQAPFSYFASIEDKFQDVTPSTASSPEVTLALNLPVNGGTTFPITFFDHNSPLTDTQENIMDSLRPWIVGFLWISFATYLAFRSFTIFRGI